MDDRLIALYERELHHLKSHAQAFAERGRHAPVARRLGLDDRAELRDPFIDWLLEGSAFLAARVQHSIEADFPQFASAILSVVYPHLSAPTPSMLIAQFSASVPGQALLDGAPVPRGTQIGFPAASGARARQDVTFRTGRALLPWPGQVAEAEYLPDAAAVAAVTGQSTAAASGIRVTVRLDTAAAASALALDEMDLFVDAGPLSGAAMEALAFSGARAGVVAGAERKRGARSVRPVTVAPLGFDDAPGAPDSLLPYDARSFAGYRLVHEYFALPDRFHFVRVGGLRRALKSVEAPEITLLFEFDRRHDVLAGRIGAESLRLNCVPAVNLFERTVDTIDLTRERIEQHVVVDRDAPLHYEIHTPTRVEIVADGGTTIPVLPFFSAAAQGGARDGDAAYYVATRRPRASARTLANDRSATHYRGSEIFVSLSGPGGGPIPRGMRSLQMKALCTNRHLATSRSKGDDRLDFGTDLAVDGARVVAGPSTPRSGIVDGMRQWEIVSHLTLNHLSLIETAGGMPHEALRQLLRLYATDAPKSTTDTLDALREVTVTEAFGRAPPRTMPGGRPAPVGFVQGLDIALRFEARTPAAPVFAAVLDRFFAGYTPVNTFTQTRLMGDEDRERVRWPKRTGLRTLL